VEVLILTPQDKGPASLYQKYRFRADLSPQDAIKATNRPAYKILYDEAWIKNTLKRLVSGALASLVS
jgi:hypothetical protein